MARRHTTATSGLDAALDGVSPKVKRAFEATHGRLTSLGIPHVLVGGLAVGVRGYQYATKDVDWLVSRHAAFEGGAVLTFRPGVPIQAEDVAIDYLTPEGPPYVVEAMEAALTTSADAPGLVVVISAELLVWMKLKAGRSKDVTAVVELLRAGALDVDSVRTFLLAAGDAKVLGRFDAAVRKAIEEED